VNSFSRFNQESFSQGPRFANPSLFPSITGNSPASHVGIRFNIHGFNATVSTGSCAGLDALEYMCDFIQRDRIQAGLVGAVEDLSIQSYLGCYKLSYLSGSNGSGSTILCPFDRRRNGIALGEGAVTFLVEDLERAKARGARIYAEVLAAGSCFGPGRHYKFNRDGEGMTRSMRLALKQADLQPRDIDCLFANANSSKDADKIEIRAVKAVFGAKADDLYVTTAKAFLGETFSASGGLSLAAALSSMENNFVPSVTNYQEKDGDCSLKNICASRVNADIATIMINAFSPSGGNSTAIIRKVK
jgi:3-oxoacyl-[acyl-carrier-protein] synthase II